MIYVCSDIHGDYAKYRSVLEKISLQAQDTLYVLGDVIDRGPDGIKILRDMMVRPNIAPILGNHELIAAACLGWLLDDITEESLAALGPAQLGALQGWMNNGGEPTFLAVCGLSREERKEILEYIKEMEIYAQVEAGGRSFLLVHAGLDHFSPEKKLEDYDLEDFLFCRPGPNKQYYPDQYLVYGHTPTRLLRKQMGEPLMDTILCGETQIAIDCGCGFGGPLGCLCLDTMEEFYG